MCESTFFSSNTNANADVDPVAGSPFPAGASLTDAFIHDNLMGPDAIMIVRELCAGPRARACLGAAGSICDLGCGMGITSMWLAREFPQATVHACDLWNSVEENGARFAEHGFAGHVLPVQADALELPFGAGCFDALVSVDSYNYFGRAEGVIDRVARHVRPGGQILLAVPGLKQPLTDAAMELFGLSWTCEQMEYLQTCAWWRDLMGRARTVRLDAVEEMACFDDAWDAWLTCDNEYARGDRAAMEAGAGALMNLIAMRFTKL